MVETTSSFGDAHDLSVLVGNIVDERLAVPLPRATYRLQFNHTFTFADATRIVPYLADLGISHVYASPIFKAVPGSMHGYDVVDYGSLNPEIGTREDFDELVAALHDHGLGLILDFVPNHMGIEGGSNAWWQDVLENGQASPYADYFDIDWTPLGQDFQGKVLLPILGDQYGTVLERGDLKLIHADGSFRIDYWGTPLPLDPSTYPVVLRMVDAALEVAHIEEEIDLLEFRSIITSLERLPGSVEVLANPDLRLERQREHVVAKHRLGLLVERSEVVRNALSDVVTSLNGDLSLPSSYDPLDSLIELQPWRPAFWRVASEEINYRRFFAINTLAAIRQEELGVFVDTHHLLLELLAEGAVDGVRIDHPDGLWNPTGYFRDLQRGYLLSIAERRLSIAEDDEREGIREHLLVEIESRLDEMTAKAPTRWPLYVVGEKILEHGEVLPEDWAVAGTVGYEFAQSTTEVMVDSEQRALFDRIFVRFTGDRLRFPELVYEMKVRQIREAFASELNVLVSALSRLSAVDRHSRDFTNADLRTALRETIACFPVYRTYLTGDRPELGDRDRRFVQTAIAQATRRNPSIDGSVFRFLEQALTLEDAPVDNASALESRWRFAMKVQQLSGPVMAKGLEDTVFYRFNRLVSLNEVGGDPSRFGISVDEFHRQNRNRLRSWPHGLLASSTHDTKRSEDVRARISVLSEVPTEWRAGLNRWSRLNRKLKVKIDGALAPHRADEYVIYQTLVGTCPLLPLSPADRESYVARLQDYTIKIAREGSRFTNWVNPDAQYEQALTDFIAGLLAPRRSRLFLEDFSAFVERIVPFGLMNGLAQQVLKLTSPGIPDLYQGTELWDDSLVDPDNRRPVDFGDRSDLLASSAGFDFTSRTDLRDPAIKLAVTARTLSLRLEHEALFTYGDYQPLTVIGPAADHVIAFARKSGDQMAIVAVPRLLLKLSGGTLDPVMWEGSSLELSLDLKDQVLHDALTGARYQAEADGQSSRIALSDLFATISLAVLTTTTTDVSEGNVLDD